MEADKDSNHAIISFYVTTNGFLAQQVASSLNIPHLSSFRGTDFNQDALSPDLIESVRMVVQRCDYLVATSSVQSEYANRVLGRTGKTKVIYNGVDVNGTFHSPKPGGQAIHLACDTGFSLKKGTHLLLKAVDDVARRHPSLSMTIVGPMEKRGSFWEALIKSQSEKPYLELIPGAAPQSLVDDMLEHSDAYITGSLGEGCSSGVIRALLKGMPIISPRTGLLGEPNLQFQNVYRCEPGDSKGLAGALDQFLADHHEGKIVVSHQEVSKLREQFSEERERGSWHEPVVDLLAKRGTTPKKRQPRNLP